MIDEGQPIIYADEWVTILMVFCNLSVGPQWTLGAFKRELGILKTWTLRFPCQKEETAAQASLCSAASVLYSATATTSNLISQRTNGPSTTTSRTLPSKSKASTKTRCQLFCSTTIKLIAIKTSKTLSASTFSQSTSHLIAAIVSSSRFSHTVRQSTVARPFGLS